MDDDGEVLFQAPAIAAEIEHLTGRPVSVDQVYRWAKTGVIRARKAGNFVVTTKAALRASFTPDAA